MALQDLTPQLRTRLSRMERAVGWFVSLSKSLGVNRVPPMAASDSSIVCVT